MATLQLSQAELELVTVMLTESNLDLLSTVVDWRKVATGTRTSVDTARMKWQTIRKKIVAAKNTKGASAEEAMPKGRPEKAPPGAKKTRKAKHDVDDNDETEVLGSQSIHLGSQHIGTAWSFHGGAQSFQTTGTTKGLFEQHAKLVNAVESVVRNNTSILSAEPESKTSLDTCIFKLRLWLAELQGEGLDDTHDLTDAKLVKLVQGLLKQGSDCVQIIQEHLRPPPTFSFVASAQLATPDTTPDQPVDLKDEKFLEAVHNLEHAVKLLYGLGDTVIECFLDANQPTKEPQDDVKKDDGEKMDES